MNIVRTLSLLLLCTFLSIGCKPKSDSGGTTKGNREWSKKTLEHFNPHKLTNAKGCPEVPGTFFVKEGERCISFFPAMSDFTPTLKGNPAYRYSVTIKKDESGALLFTEEPQHLERCEKNPKIQYLRKTLKQSHSIEITPGKASIAVANAESIVPDGVVCRFSAAPQPAPAQ